MKIKNKFKTTSLVNVSFFLIIFFLIIYLIFSFIDIQNSVGVFGHDSYQYIFFSLNTDFYDEIYFYRPTLYVILNIFLKYFFNFSPNGYMFTILIHYLMSILIFSIISKITLRSNFLTYISVCFFLASPYLLSYTFMGHITPIELLYFLFFILFLTLSFKLKKIIYIIPCSLFAFIGMHLHEDKIILYFIIIFSSFVFLKKNQYLVLVFLTIFLFIFYLLQFDIFHIFEIFSRSSESINLFEEEHFLKKNFFLKFLKVFLYSNSLLFNEYVLILVFISLLFYLFFNKKIFFFKNNLQKVLFISPMIYIFFLSVFLIIPDGFYRTLIPVFVFNIILIVQNLNCVAFNLDEIIMLQNDKKKLLVIKSTTFLLVTLTTIFLFINKISHEKESISFEKHKSKTAFDLVNTLNLDSLKILMSFSFDNRNLSWGDHNLYSLASDLYFGSKQAINLRNYLKINSLDRITYENLVNNFNVVIFDKRTSIVDEIAIIEQLSNYWDFIESNDVLIYYNARST